jgi:hypothetical protein
MAEFTYGVRFEGSEIGKSLSETIVNKIDSEKNDGGIALVKCQDFPGYNYSYKFNFPNEHFVLFGIKKFPGKLYGTETVSFAFAGSPEKILTSKAMLEEMIDGLELF